MQIIFIASVFLDDGDDYFDFDDDDGYNDNDNDVCQVSNNFIWHKQRCIL